MRSEDEDIHQGCEATGGHTWASDGSCSTCGTTFKEMAERGLYTADVVNHPPHYTSHPSGIECITVTEHMGFNLGNVIKYLWRAEDKGSPIEDLKKARWYLDREIARREAMPL